MKRLLFLCCLCLLLLCGCGDSADKTTYEDAVARMNAGSSESARALFLTIPDYMDASALAEKCQGIIEETERQRALDAATDLYYAGDFAAARDAFAALGAYENAAEYARVCSEKVQEGLYAGAREDFLALTKSSDWPASLNGIVDALSSCPDNARAQLLLPALRELRAGDYERAGAEVRLLLEASADPLGREVWNERFETLLSSCLNDPEKAVAVTAGWRKLFPELPCDPARAAAADSGAFRADIDEDALLSRCAAAPAGKILIYVTKRNYLGRDWAHIDCGLMRIIPAEYYPASLAETEYLVKIHYDYKRVKKFNTYYTDGIREYAEISVSHLPDMRSATKSVTVLAPSAKSLDTAVMTSEFVSGGPPDPADVADALVALLDTFLVRESGKTRYRAADGRAFPVWDDMPDADYAMPSAVDGLPVVGFSPALFARRRWLERVSLPDSLLYIPADAFSGAERLNEISVPASVLRFGERAFPTNVTLIAPQGSRAERYALDNGINTEN